MIKKLICILYVFGLDIFVVADFWGRLFWSKSTVGQLVKLGLLKVEKKKVYQSPKQNEISLLLMVLQLSLTNMNYCCTVWDEPHALKLVLLFPKK